MNNKDRERDRDKRKGEKGRGREEAEKDKEEEKQGEVVKGGKPVQCSWTAQSFPALSTGGVQTEQRGLGPSLLEISSPHSLPAFTVLKVISLP